MKKISKILKLIFISFFCGIIGLFILAFILDKERVFYSPEFREEVFYLLYLSLLFACITLVIIAELFIKINSLKASQFYLSKINFIFIVMYLLSLFFLSVIKNDFFHTIILPYLTLAGSFLFSLYLYLNIRRLF